jgi:hypothetical protein
MKRALCLLSLFLILPWGCVSEEEAIAAKQERENAIRTIQNSRSVEEGTTTLQYLSALLSGVQARGSAVEVIGWHAVVKYVPGQKNSGFDVHFDYKERGKQIRVFWVVTETGEIQPISDLAKTITPTGQRATQ